MVAYVNSETRLVLSARAASIRTIKTASGLYMYLSPTIQDPVCLVSIQSASWRLVSVDSYTGNYTSMATGAVDERAIGRRLKRSCAASVSVALCDRSFD